MKDKLKRVFRRFEFLVGLEWPSAWLPRWVKEERTKTSKALIALKEDSIMLEWILDNNAPGPVCWFRDSNREEWLMCSREDVAKRMNETNKLFQ